MSIISIYDRITVMLWSSLPFLIFVLASHSIRHDICPCGSEELHSNYEQRPLIICSSRKLLPVQDLAVSLYGISLIQITDYRMASSNYCDIFLHTSKLEGFATCPGECNPVPKLLVIPTQLQRVYFKGSPLLCSLTSPMLINSTRTLGRLDDDIEYSNDEIILSFFKMTNSFVLNRVSIHSLRILVWRRIQECREPYHWISDAPFTKYNRVIYGSNQIFPLSRIKALIIWVGSTSRQFLLNEQLRVLGNQKNTGSASVVGWTVTEDIFPCSEGSTQCTYNTSVAGDFMTYAHANGISRSVLMPKSFLHNNSRGAGWGCAQRRPLRALAHALYLFDPDYIVLVDDDTLVNYPLVDWYHNKLLRSEYASKPWVVGHYILKRALTAKGLFFGGTGYIIGPRAIERLRARQIAQIRAPKRDRYAWELSLVREIRFSDRNCRRPCLLSHTSSNGSLRLADRLIDVCVQLMAKEGTCYHSDYSMSRCLFYGAYVEPVALDCDPSEFPRLCSMNRSDHNVCDLTSQLTCHRWRAAPADTSPSPSHGIVTLTYSAAKLFT